ncbi:MAG TPA: PDZ domain-containing protein [Gemmatimonadales bacterium]|nr:PDZ domain-containing protein [Gemmatimonadales bacterium]
MPSQMLRGGLLLALFAGGPAAAPAQDAEVRIAAENRGRIGVMIDADREADSLGARIRDVVPGGPAEGAGLRAGDIITRFNDATLRGDRDPGRRLLRLARGLEPGDTVRLEYRRGDDTRTATLVAERMPRRLALAMGDMEELGRHFGDMGRRLERNFDFHVHRRHAGLELVELNQDLGEYFGASEGLLVVRPPADSANPLKAGDVIVTIDGRKPQSAAHAHRILRSYEDGEKAKLEVLRKRKKTTLEWQVPERDAEHEHPAQRRPARRGTPGGWS